jgi:AdoMet-dependent rRNA methyltransferase SPB1
LTDLDGNAGETQDGLSKRAAAFFNQDIFKEITEGSLLGENNTTTQASSTNTRPQALSAQRPTQSEPLNGFTSDDEDDSRSGRGFEVVKTDDADNWEEKDKRRSDGRLGKFIHCCPFV